ncbi:hypothetical protein BD626DRAFT_632101 [Schizophyllum amplum]|uniref:NACHT domain-containing protein n=1 Tax=Schizophyllum amplum TaxID=97359 RepID=A0A550C803_9AGAR|nr:hypothetical protein BD626DRAFT_632101 [Auriculariopsis ampla]
MSDPPNSSTPSIPGAPTSSSTSAPTQAPAHTLARLWKEAVERYEKTTGLDLAACKVLDSEGAINKHIEQHESAFKNYRADGPQELRSKIKPIAAVVQTLCGVFGEAVTMARPYSPVKAVFAAIGVIIQASRKVSEDLDAVVDAFDTMEHHLRIIKPIAAVDMHDALKEASVKLLGQILVVLGVITNLQKNNRLKIWLKKLCQSKDVPSALDELGRLATQHHRTVSAVTLHVVNKTLLMLENSCDWQDKYQEFTRMCITQIADIARETHTLLCQTITSSVELTTSRTILESIQATLLHMSDETMKEKKSGDVDKICRWLRYPDCSVKLNSVMFSRVPGTGSWFLDGNTFGSFISGDVRVLWLHGQAGSGKSTLMAAIIRELQAHCASSSGSCITLTHLFDLTNGAQSQDMRALLSSLLCQLAYHRDDARKELLEVRNQQMDGHTQPSLEKMQHHLWRLIRRSARLFVVLDALDEANIEDLIPFLRALRAYSNIALLVSSRTEVHLRMELVRLSDAEVHMSTELITRDIETFLHCAVGSAGVLAHMSADYAELVQQKLCDGAAGNFRWASLQVRELAPVAGLPAFICGALENLSQTLGDFYDQALSRIPKARCEVVLRLLAWLVFAHWPLSKAEFSELLAFSHPKSQTMPVYNPKLRARSTDDIMCVISSTFVSYDGDCVRLAHASVRDHLLKLPTTSPFHIDAHRAYCDMTRMCLAYLTHVGVDTPWRRKNPGYPLHVHVARNWMTYADEGLRRQQDLEQDLIDFLTLNKRVQQCGDYDSRYFWSRCPIHIAVQHGYARVIRLYDHLKADVKACQTEGWRPLHIAIKYCDGDDVDGIIRALIDIGVDANDRDKGGGTALHEAVRRRANGVVIALLTAGASTNIRDEQGKTALWSAVDSCDTDTVRLLIAAGADMNIADNAIDTLLGRAVSHSSTDVLALLLRAGAAINIHDADGRAPLHLAATHCRKDMTRLLLDAGADVNIRDRVGRTALSWLTFPPYHVRIDGITRLLLEAGADVNTRDDSDMTPLHHVIQNGVQGRIFFRLDAALINGTIRLLLKAGADVNSRDDVGKTPLHYTIHAILRFLVHQRLSQTTGWQDLVRLLNVLLAAGADRDVRDDCGKSPLDLAEDKMKSVMYSWERRDLEQAFALLRQPITRSITQASDGTAPGGNLAVGEERQDTAEAGDGQA